MALQIFGTDFSLIENIFEGKRTREQIKNKFRKEEKKNKIHIDVILSNKAGKTLKDFEEKYGSLNLGQIDDEALNDPNLFNIESSSDEEDEESSEPASNSNEINQDNQSDRENNNKSFASNSFIRSLN